MPTPYLGKDIHLELDFTGAGSGGTKINAECWITGYQISSTAAETTDVQTMCPTGQYSLAGKSGGYTLTLDYINDVCDANSLTWLLLNFPDATNIPFKLIERGGCQTGIEIDGIISSLPSWSLGASAGQVSSVSGAVFPLAGKPTIIKAAAAPAIASVSAGTPGSFGPAGSIPPVNLVALKANGVVGDSGTAKPSGAAWTTGQYVLLGDGSKAHWSGTTWLAGVA